MELPMPPSSESLALIKWSKPGIIYVARNRVNGKLYVGQTVYGLETRRRWHRNKSNYPDTVFERAVRKYGIDGFEFVEVQNCNDKLCLNEAERWWIKNLDSMVPSGYNRDRGGSGGCPVTPETRKRMSEAQLARKQNPSEETRRKLSWNASHLSPETIEKRRIAATGKKHTEDTRKHLSEVAKKRSTPERMKAMSQKAAEKGWTDEMKAKVSKTLREKHANGWSPNKGRKWTPEQHAKKKLQVVSEESRKKMGDSRRGKPRSEETKKKIGDAHRGKKLSPEHVAKMSASRKGMMAGADNPFYGRHHTEETKRKLSEINSKWRPSDEQRRKMSDTHKRLKSYLRLNKNRKTRGKEGQMGLNFEHGRDL
jgi:hypothetical protein